MSAQATSFMNYGSISGISKNTANYYIEQGISQATALSLNYGCSKPVVSDEAAARFTGDVNAAWESINDKIEQIKANKKTQYEGYQTYLAQGGGNPISPDYMNKFNYLMNYIGVLVVLVRSQANASFANSRLESTLEQMIDIKDVKKRSLKERIHFVDTIAAILIGVFPEVTYEIGRQYKVPIQGGYIYYGTNVNEKLRPGAESPINVLVDSERDKFKDFSVSTGMGGVLVTFNSKGIVTISGQTDMGTSRADVSMKLDTSTGKAFGEYSSTVNAQGKISLTTI